MLTVSFLPTLWWCWAHVQTQSSSVNSMSRTSPKPPASILVCLRVPCLWECQRVLCWGLADARPIARYLSAYYMGSRTCERDTGISTKESNHSNVLSEYVPMRFPVGLPNPLGTRCGPRFCYPPNLRAVGPTCSRSIHQWMHDDAEATWPTATFRHDDWPLKNSWVCPVAEKMKFLNVVCRPTAGCFQQNDSVPGNSPSFRTFAEETRSAGG